MNDPKRSALPARTATRRGIIGGAAAALGGLAAGGTIRGLASQQDKLANPTRTSLHQEVALHSSPMRVYQVLLDPKQFTAFTGMTAEINPEMGGAFSLFGGMIVGRNIELIPSQRIVQAWRPTHWDPGVYSLVKFELKAQGSQTLVVLDHTGFPEGDFDHLDPGWKQRYWDPLTKYLG
jgi:activator of HSP90 ATPase